MSGSPEAARERGAEDAARQRKRFFDQARAMTSLLAVETDAGTFIVPTWDIGVGRKLFTSAFRPEMRLLGNVMAVLESLGDSDRARRGTFIDVGANVGTTTIPALIQHGFSNALAIEPEPENFRLLLVNVAANGLHESVLAYRVALSDVPGLSRLALSDENSGDHRLLVGGAGPHGASERVIDVETTTLDGLLARASLRPRDVGLIWIDVQGREGHVVAGARELLRSRPPLVFEFWPSLLEEAGGVERLVETLSDEYEYVVDLRQSQPPDRLKLTAIRELAGVAEPTEFLVAGSRRRRRWSFGRGSD